MNFFSLLTIAFIVLKLTDAISWSWWWAIGEGHEPWLKSGSFWRGLMMREG